LLFSSGNLSTKGIEQLLKLGRLPKKLRGGGTGLEMVFIEHAEGNLGWSWQPHAGREFVSRVLGAADALPAALGLGARWVAWSPRALQSLRSHPAAAARASCAVKTALPGIRL